jgi:hypothetical protein
MQVLQRRLSSSNCSSSSVEVVEADAQMVLVDAEPAKLPDMTGTWIKVRPVTYESAMRGGTVWFH